MTPSTGQPFELLFWAIVIGPGLFLALVAAMFRRSWILWGVGGVLATMLAVLLAEKVGQPGWGALAERGYSQAFVSAVRAATAAGAVTLLLLLLMSLTRPRPLSEPPMRQEPVNMPPAAGIAGRAEILRVPAEVFVDLLAAEQLEPALEAGSDGDRIRVRRRGGGTVGYLPRLQGMEVAMLARRGGRLRMWIADRQAGRPGEPGVVQVAYEETPRGQIIPVEAPAQGAPAAAAATAHAEAEPAVVGGAGPEAVLPDRQPLAPTTGAARGDIASQLATLASLKFSGALSEAEFEAAKRKVLQI